MRVVILQPCWVNRELPAFVDKFAEMKEDKNRLGATYLDDSIVPAHSADVLLLLVRAAHRYINNTNKVPLLKETFLYRAGLDMFERLREIFQS